MYVRTTLVLGFALLAILIGVGGTVQAGELGAGPVYGGLASIGGGFICRVFNYGPVPVTISQRQIWDNTGSEPFQFLSDTCNVTLGVGKSCAFAASINGNLAFSCRVVVSGSNPKISGVAEIQDLNNAIVTRIPFR